MNPGNLDKFQAHMSLVRREPQAIVPTDPTEDLDARQAAFVIRRFGLSFDSARLIAALAFAGGAS